MAQITAEMVKDLRARTGVGMMECKKALVEANGEVEAAIEALRKAGAAKAVKKGDRITAEGLLSVCADAGNKKAYIVELNCETDFVAREQQFQEFVVQVAQAASDNSVSSIEDLSTQKLSTGKTVEEQRLQLVAKIGENVTLRRVSCLESAGCVGVYMHGGSATARIAALVAIDSNDLDLARDLAMQVCAMKPEYLDESQVPEQRIAKEKEILLAQANEENPGKPADILEKIVAGKISKLMKEITLVGQSFVKDSNLTVAKLLKEKSANITGYLRLEVGEGIEKKADDFVNEVMAQVKS